MADTTEKITYEIVVDDSKATGATEDLAKGLGKVSDSADKAKKSTESFTDSLDKAVPGLGSAVKGFGAMTKSALAFIATPIGRVIGALGLAVGALTKYFQGSEEGQNRLNKIMAVGSAIMEKLTDVVENVGEAIYNAFTNPKKALTELVDFIKQNLINRFQALGVIMEGIANLDFKQVANGVLQLGTGVVDVIGKVQTLASDIVSTMETAIQQGTRLADLAAQIDRDERKLLVERAKVSLEIAKLREEAATREGQAKRTAIEDAIRLETQLSDKEVSLARLRKEQADLRLKTNGDDKEALLEVANATAALIQAEALRYENTLRFRKQLEALDEEDAKRREEYFAGVIKQNDDEVDANDKKFQSKLASQIRFEADSLKKTKEQIEAEKKIEALKAGAISGLIAKTLGERVNAQKLYTTLFKKGALGETVTNTKAAAIAAYKSLAGIPLVGTILGAIAAAAAVAFGVEQATGIQAVQFHRGGLLRGPSHARGGIPFTVGGRPGFEAEGGEAIINKRSTAMFRDQLSAINAAGGGVRFENGGIPFATTQIANQINQDKIFQTMIDVMMATSQKVLVVEDLELRQSQIRETENRATF